jgi:hypothetical protein
MKSLSQLLKKKNRLLMRVSLSVAWLLGLAGCSSEKLELAAVPNIREHAGVFYVSREASPALDAPGPYAICTARANTGTLRQPPDGGWTTWVIARRAASVSTNQPRKLSGSPTLFVSSPRIGNVN